MGGSPHRAPVQTILDAFEPKDSVQPARLELVTELLKDLRRVDERLRALKKKLTDVVAASVCRSLLGNFTKPQTEVAWVGNEQTTSQPRRR